jgi:DivIVA domain-containing protein
VIVFFLLIVVLLIGLTAAAVMGKIGGFMAEPTSTHAFSGAPSGSLSADEVKGLRFDQALRGYRMDQVDETIDALAERLRQLEAAAAPLPPAGASLPAAATPLAPSGDAPSDSRDLGEQ